MNPKVIVSVAIGVLSCLAFAVASWPITIREADRTLSTDGTQPQKSSIERTTVTKKEAESQNTPLPQCRGGNLTEMLKNCRGTHSALDSSSARMLMGDGKVVSGGAQERMRAWSRARESFKAKGSVIVRPGLLAAGGRLLVSMNAGVTSGALVFVADAGASCYRYWQGDIMDAEFAEGVSDAAIKGLAVGLAVGVAVMLGATPTGWCVLAVATTTYLVVDISLRVYREIDERRFLREADLAAFGVNVDSPLYIRDSILPPVEDSLRLLPDSPLDPVF